MVFFEKFQEVFYDILGYIVPSLILSLYLGPLILLKYSNLDTGVFSPAYAILNIDKYYKVFNLINFEYSFSKFIIIFLILYIFGHLIRAGSIVFYTLLFEKHSKISFYKGRSQKEKLTFRPLEKKVQESLYKVLSLSPSIENDKKVANKLTYSYARATIRTNCISTLVPKYIAKYNLYLSLSVIFAVISFDLAMFLIGEMFLLSKVNLIEGAIALAVAIAFHFIFDYEYRRHFQLSRKEALFGMLHHLENKSQSGQ